MRKNILKIILGVFCFLFIMPISFGCAQAKINEYSNEYISEYRKNLFIGKTGLFWASFTSGERESDYVMNGQKTNLVDFGVLTIKLNADMGSDNPKFELDVNDKKYSGELEKNPYDGSYVFDIQVQVDDKDEIFVTLTDFDQKIKLICLSCNWESSWQDAVDVFYQKYLNEVSNNTVNGKFLGEIYVKIVATDNNFDNIYWYVLCVCKNGDMFTCLVDPNTKMILQA